MEVINYNDKEYIMLDDLLSECPKYSKGCRSSRNIITKHNIDKQYYEFVRKNNNGEWISACGKSIKYDKIIILKSFIKTIEEYNKQQLPNKPDIIILKCNHENEIIKDIDIYKDDQQNIYFKHSDLSKQIIVDINMIDTLTINTDYKYFYCNNKKTLFITYQGLMCILFTTKSKNNKTESFIKWACDILRIMHLGDEKEKNIMISKIKKVSLNTVEELFNESAVSMPEIYLTKLNSVKKLRQKMNINNEYCDEDYVYKIGITNCYEKMEIDFINDNKDELNEIIDLELIKSVLIDPLFTSKAENEITILFESQMFIYKNNKILIMSERDKKLIEEIFESIKINYSGHNFKLLQQLEKNKSLYIDEKNKYLHIHEINELKRAYEIKELKQAYEIKELLIQKELETYKNFFSK
jgi:hypothetical protein